MTKKKKKKQSLSNCFLVELVEVRDIYVYNSENNILLMLHNTQSNAFSKDFQCKFECQNIFQWRKYSTSPGIKILSSVLGSFKNTLNVLWFLLVSADDRY